MLFTFGQIEFSFTKNGEKVIKGQQKKQTDHRFLESSEEDTRSLIEENKKTTSQR